MSPALLLHLAAALVVTCSPAADDADATVADATPAPERATRALPDGVELTVDVYRHPDGSGHGSGPRPVLVCFHAARSSRAEYRPMVRGLLELGCEVVAVDLRHGGVGEQWDRREKRRFGTPNETWRSAREHLGRELPSRESSYVDMVAAVEWAHELFPGAPLGLVGSSFSATMVLVYGAEHPERVAAVAAFSPAAAYLGEWDVLARVHDLRLPTFVTSGSLERERRNAKELVDAIPVEVDAVLLPPPANAAHGAKSLAEANEATRAKQWAMLERMVAVLRERATR